MNDLRWINETEIARLPEVYQTLANDIGIKGARTFIALYQGTNLYLPKIDDLIAEIRNCKIRNEFNGHNHKFLAVKYGLTARWIYEILTPHEEKENEIRAMREEKEKQLKFF